MVDEALSTVTGAIGGTSGTERVLLRASAGAGKSFALVRMVHHALSAGGAKRVAVTAFTNKQVQPLARRLAEELGKDVVALLAGKDVQVPDPVTTAATVVRRTAELPGKVKVVVGTASRLGAPSEARRLRDHLGADGDAVFDVLFVDEAWQMSEHLFAKVRGLGRVVVGVGDVGQLPPLDPGENPWRGTRATTPTAPGRPHSRATP
ncbi:AAA family ATPase [Cellulomonas sp. ATA003]|uniref:AAA family ATPase n=1 Tax=Cellulomonas sp. ATA003 TaxID=3073064 RepID=UPI0028738405|nr:AAA family ATPase [Cellulomonas sp. ATA003]WNB86460.1 AAA family ATPase [Cellulomonas sp. ATA003]